MPFSLWRQQYRLIRVTLLCVPFLKFHSQKKAWTKLGQAQAENDQDKQAISALEQAVALDHHNSEALIALAVSHVCVQPF